MATPKKSVSFLSPSVKNVCFSCQKTMSLEEKRNLWKEGKKSNALLMIEGLLRITISSIDFGAICRGCLRKMENISKKIEAMKKQVDDGRELAHNFTRNRWKRGRKLVNSGSKNKKQLFGTPDDNTNGEDERVEEYDLEFPTKNKVSFRN